MKLFLKTGLVVVLLSAAAVVSQASPLTVDNTGVNSTDTGLVSAGAQAYFWTLESEPGGATEAIGSETYRYHNGAYFGDTSDAAWVSMAANGNASSGGFYVYEMTLDLTGYDPASVSLQGFFGTDNNGFIRVNGGAAAATTGASGFGSPTAFTLSSGFVSGLNTIEVGVDNLGNPTAFYVRFTSAEGTPAAVPEPASLLLLGTGLGAAFFLRRRRSSNV